MLKTIALVGDLHGNLPALEAVDADIRARSADAIWCLGDLVGKGPSSAETFDWAVDNCPVILRGNWDEGVGLKQFAMDGFYYQQLGKKRMQALLSFPLEHHEYISGRRLRLLHGRPLMRDLQHIQDAPDTLKWLFEPDFDVVGYADCHKQGLRTFDVASGMGQLFNTGSTGNAIGMTMAQYALLRGDFGGDAAPLDITFVTLPYDRERAVRDALAAPELPRGAAYINEVRTGVYSRK